MRVNKRYEIMNFGHTFLDMCQNSKLEFYHYEERMQPKGK
jgi:hypothetical protein